MAVDLGKITSANLNAGFSGHRRPREHVPLSRLISRAALADGGGVGPEWGFADAGGLFHPVRYTRVIAGGIRDRPRFL